MAEIVGVVSSGAGLVSLGVQMLSASKKLKNFYDNVKDAPEDIAHLLKWLDLINTLIQEIKTKEAAYQEIFAHSPSLKVSLALCEEDVTDVAAIATKLDTALKKGKKKGSIRAVLKASEIGKVKEKLRDTIRILMVSCSISGISQIFLHALSISQQIPATTQIAPTTVITSQASLSVHSASDAVDEDIEGEKQQCTLNQDCITINKPRQNTLSFQLPSWLAKQRYQIRYSARFSGWTMSDLNLGFRTRNIVPWTSPLFQAASTADLHDVRRLFETGQASPYDIGIDGRDALQVALFFNRSSPKELYEFCRFFATVWDDDLFLEDHFRYIPRSLEDNDGYTHGIFDMILSKIDGDVDLLNPLWSPGRESNVFYEDSCLTPDAIRLLKRKLVRPLETYPLEQRLEETFFFILHFERGSRHVIENAKERICCDFTDPHLLDLVFDCNEASLFHNRSLFVHIIEFFGIAYARGDQQVKVEMTGFLRSATAHHVDLLKAWMTEEELRTERGFIVVLPTTYYTILNAFLRSAIVTPGRCRGLDEADWVQNFENDVSHALYFYLDCLVGAGIDLTTSGRGERRVMRKAHRESAELHVYRICKPMAYQCSCEPFRECRIWKFEYGPRPEDWKAHFSWRLNQRRIWEAFAGQFWHLVECPTDEKRLSSSIPGAWATEWDSRNEWDIRGSDIPRNQRRIFLPNRGWRRNTARMLARAEAVYSDTTKKELVREHHERLRRGAIRKSIDHGWFVKWMESERSYEHAKEITSYEVPWNLTF